MQMRNSFSFFTLSVNGGSVIEIEKQILLEESIKMIVGGDKLRNFNYKQICEGKVSTQKQTVVLGTLTGYLCEADMESERGKIKISFGVDKQLIGWHLEKQKESLQRKYGDLFKQSDF